MKTWLKVKILIIYLCMLFAYPVANLHAQSVSDFLDMDSLVLGRHSVLLVNNDAANLPTDWNPWLEASYVPTCRNANASAVYRSTLYVELDVNEPELALSGPVGNIEVTYDIKYMVDSNGTYQHAETKTLEVEYDPNGNYKFRSVDVYEGVTIALVNLRSIKIGDGPALTLSDINGNVSPTELSAIAAERAHFYPFQFHVSLEAVPAFNFPASKPIAKPDSLYCRYIPLSGDLEFFWNNDPEPRASYTELQWSFVNNYQGTNLPVNFRTNATSVQIPAFGNGAATSYRIPCVFELGTVVYRIRWIGKDKFGRPLYGPWSALDIWPNVYASFNRYTYYFTITTALKHEADKKNWQYIAAFAEEGKHKDVVTYYDGTMRNRQAVTRLNGGQVLDGNDVIVAETIYDFQGRPAIQVLPAPVSKKEVAISGNQHSGGSSGSGLGAMFQNLGMAYNEWASANPAPGEIAHDAPANDLPQRLKYYSNYNVVKNGFVDYEPYSWANFDKGPFTCPLSGMIAAPMDSFSGAALYYSKNNRDQHGANAFLPRADGYPFAQTEYMSDNTGRVRRQGGVGKELQIGGGHDTRYYYGVPSQNELDRFFGNDVGRSSYYKKNMVADPNGQMAVQYLDMKGNIIASGLTGACPVNVDALDNRWVFKDTADMLTNQQSPDVPLNNIIQSSYVMLLPADGEVAFDYKLNPGQAGIHLCQGSDWCLDCEYDYTIKIFNECGVLVIADSARGIGAGNLPGQIDTFNTVCPATINQRDSFKLTQTLPKGSYLVTRTLVVTPRSISAYQSKFDQDSICQSIKDSLSLGIKLAVPDGGCNVKCSNCTSTATTEVDASIQNVGGVDGVGGVNYTIPARPAGFVTSCANLCDTTGSSIESYLHIMRSDVALDGMYGRVYAKKETMGMSAVQNIDSLDPLSVYNTSTGPEHSNLLGTEKGDHLRNWRYPAKSQFNPEIAYCDADGTISWVLISLETEQVYRNFWGEEHFNELLNAGVEAKYDNGKLYVRPDKLRTLEEFIAAWKPSWANALLPYHPEYLSLLQYMRNAVSNSYDDTLGKLLSYQSWVQLNGGGSVAPTKIMDRDPYNWTTGDHPVHTTPWTFLNDSLFLLAYTTPRGDVSNIEYSATAANYCAVEGMEDGNFVSECVGSHHLFTTGNDRIDKEWQMYKGVYLSYKRRYQDSIRAGEFPLTILSGDNFSRAGGANISYEWPSNLKIGDTLDRTNVYRDKQMRFPTMKDMFRNYVCHQTAGGVNPTVEELLCSANQVDRIFKDSCNKCPTTLHLEALLLAMTNEGKLDSTFSDNIMGYYFFRSDIRNSLGNNIVKVSWEPRIAGNELSVAMHTTRRPPGGMETDGTVHTIKFKSSTPGINWATVSYVRCLNYTESPQLYPFSKGKNFTIRFLDTAGVEYLAEGISSCFILNNCDTIRDCTETADAAGLQNLFTHLFAQRNRIRSTGYLLCDQQVSHATAIYPESLQHFRASDDNTQNVWKWHLISQTDYSLKGSIDVVADTTSSRCTFTFTFLGRPGIDFNNLPFYITKLTAEKEDKCTLKNFLLHGYAMVGHGHKVPFILKAVVQNGCFTISECCRVEPVKRCPNIISNPGFAFATVSSINHTTVNLGYGKLTGGNLAGKRIGSENTIQSTGGLIGGLSALSANYIRLFKPVNLPSISFLGHPFPEPLVIWQQYVNVESNANYTFSFLYKVFEGTIPPGNPVFEIDTDGRGFKPVALTSRSVTGGFQRLSGSFNAVSTRQISLRIVYRGRVIPDALAGIDDLLLESDKCSRCCPEIIRGSPPVALDSCEQSKQYLRDFGLAYNFNREVERERLRIGAEYTRKCLENADRFKAVLDNSVYQVTLFYYDQAGNLIKTVPPKGVDTLSRENITTAQNYRNGLTGSTAVYPGHKLTSTYQYDALNQVTEKTSPDAGASIIHYDSLGRVHLSRNALQTENGKASYIVYDDIGRIKESGECVNPDSGLSRKSQHALRNYILDAATAKREVVRIYYDKPMTAEVNGYFAGGQQNLRNRIASTTYSLNGIETPYDHATHYSYDIHGNAKTLIQQNNDADLPIGQRLKRIDYDYDLISGKTNEVWYQKGEADQYIHRYVYDADNRVTDVFSGTHPRYLENDASYIFYKHGPLARMELGQQKVQCMDYAYTLQGWLKAINSNALLPENDMGADGATGSITPADKMGFSLHYFAGDYVPISGSTGFLANTLTGDALSAHLLPADVHSSTSPHHSLFNGNIAATVSSLKDAAIPVMLNLHQYDQLQRLTSTTSLNAFSGGNSWSAGTQMYKSTYSYDANGNIKNLKRWQGANLFDDLDYTYHNNDDNRLYNLKDNVGSLGANIDISGEKNYNYDAIGNLTGDGDNSITWSATGRIKQYGANQSYMYDAAQRRVTKTIGTNKQYYVYDPQGNIMSLYEKQQDQPLKWTASPIYGGSRAGIYRANKEMPESSTTPSDTLNFYRGHREYELTDHLGNVLVSVSDNEIRKSKHDMVELCADARSAQDYFPYGMQLPGRGMETISNYRFAYNGMEQDKKDDADGYTTEFRQYDPRIGRWMGIDPVVKESLSPYQSFLSNPVRASDPIGADEDDANVSETESRDRSTDFATDEIDFGNTRDAVIGQVADNYSAALEAANRLAASVDEQISHAETGLAHYRGQLASLRALEEVPSSISATGTALTSAELEELRALPGTIRAVESRLSDAIARREQVRAAFAEFSSSSSSYSRDELEFLGRIAKIVGPILQVNSIVNDIREGRTFSATWSAGTLAIGYYAPRLNPAFITIDIARSVVYPAMRETGRRMAERTSPMCSDGFCYYGELGNVNAIDLVNRAVPPPIAPILVCPPPRPWTFGDSRCSSWR